MAGMVSCRRRTIAGLPVRHEFTRVLVDGWVSFLWGGLLFACGGRTIGDPYGPLGENPGTSESSPTAALAPDACDRICQASATCQETLDPECVERCRLTRGGASEHCVIAWNVWQSCTLESPDCEPVLSERCARQRAELESCMSSQSATLDPGADGAPHADGGPGPSIDPAGFPDCQSLESPLIACGPSSVASIGDGACEASCFGADGQHWASFCEDSQCRCLFNGYTYCVCSRVAPALSCSSCCPGFDST
jgi:hypothetical protein